MSYQPKQVRECRGNGPSLSRGPFGVEGIETKPVGDGSGGGGDDWHSRYLRKTGDAAHEKAEQDVADADGAENGPAELVVHSGRHCGLN